MRHAVKYRDRDGYEGTRYVYDRSTNEEAAKEVCRDKAQWGPITILHVYKEE